MLRNPIILLIMLIFTVMRLLVLGIQHSISFKTFDASFVLTNKSSKVVAKYIEGKHKSPKTCVWVSKELVSNVKGPKTVWVPKDNA
jgi:hypothetical protein